MGLDGRADGVRDGGDAAGVGAAADGGGSGREQRSVSQCGRVAGQQGNVDGVVTQVGYRAAGCKAGGLAMRSVAPGTALCDVQ